MNKNDQCTASPHLTHFAPPHPCLVEMMGPPEPTHARSVSPPPPPPPHCTQKHDFPHQVSHQRNENDLLCS